MPQDAIIRDLISTFVGEAERLGKSITMAVLELEASQTILLDRKTVALNITGLVFFILWSS